jgi:cytochrome c553
MQAYKSGALPATLMHQIAKGYSDEQIQAIAAYFAAQKN